MEHAWLTTPSTLQFEGKSTRKKEESEFQADLSRFVAKAFTSFCSVYAGKWRENSNWPGSASSITHTGKKENGELNFELYFETGFTKDQQSEIKTNYSPANSWFSKEI